MNKYFGFATDDLAYNEKYVGNFGNSNFIRYDLIVWQDNTQEDNTQEDNTQEDNTQEDNTQEDNNLITINKAKDILESILKEYDLIVDKIQAQYRDTNIKELISGIIEIKKKYVINAYYSLIKDNLSLSTAKGDALDLWGSILGLSRYFPSEPINKNYNYFNFNDKNFFKLIFNNPNHPSYNSLPDDAFRDLLLFLLEKMFIYPSLELTNEFISDYFKKYGGVVINDSINMNYSVFWFQSEIPSWLKYYFTKNDILPRPAGVGTNFGVDENFYFGFATDDLAYNEKYVGGFYKSNFLPFEEL